MPKTKLKQAIATTALTASISFLPPIISDSEFHTSAEYAAAYAQKQQSDKKMERERTIEQLLKENSNLTKREAEATIDYPLPHPIDIYELKKDGKWIGFYAPTTLELLTDKSCWQKIRWKAHDQLPEEVRNLVLDRIFSHYSYANSKDFALDQTALDTLPGPILVSNYFKKIDYWVRYWHPKRNENEIAIINNIQISIMLVESFCQHSLESRGDYGLFQTAPEIMRKLRRSIEFKAYATKDFLMPDPSIKAGTYEFKKCLEEARDDLNLAIRTYNVGILDAKLGTKRAINYESAVKDRHFKYIRADTSPSLSRILQESQIQIDSNSKRQLQAKENQSRLEESWEQIICR